MKTAEQRFFRKVVETESCWIWRGATNRQGYGQMFYEGRLQLAHRVAWKLLVTSSLADDLKLLHKCDNPPCVNPAHLRCGTQLDNVRDMHAKNRARKRNDSFTGERRIYWSKIRRRYAVDISVGNNRRKFIGRFADLNSAIIARDKAEKELR